MGKVLVLLDGDDVLQVVTIHNIGTFSVQLEIKHTGLVVTQGLLCIAQILAQSSAHKWIGKSIFTHGHSHSGQSIIVRQAA